MEKGSDKDLREAVRRQLEWAPEIDINVSPKEGGVTLTGFVHSHCVKVAVEEDAKSVYGVKAVTNDIDVKPTTRQAGRAIPRRSTRLKTPEWPLRPGR